MADGSLYAGGVSLSIHILLAIVPRMANYFVMAQLVSRYFDIPEFLMTG